MAVRVKDAKRAKVSAGWVKLWAKRTSGVIGENDSDLSVVFLTPAGIRKLNAKYRRKDQPTDTLSFPSDTKGDLGDIFIAPAVASAKAKERGMSYRGYLALLIVHGVLHLAGFDHHTAKDSSAMGKMEDKILKRL